MSKEASRCEHDRRSASLSADAFDGQRVEGGRVGGEGKKTPAGKKKVNRTEGHY